MKTPPIVSPQEWEAARQRLLVKEKEVTRPHRDALAAERRRMPWLAVENEYEFEGPKGKASLLDLFDSQHQLILYRAFLEPGVFGWPDHACPGCSLVADQVAHVGHLNARDTALVFASPRPAGRHRTSQGPDGLGDSLVHDDRRLRRRLRSGRMGAVPTRSSVMATASSALISSTTAATKPWAAPGATST